MKRLAKDLLEHFGGFAGVLSAEPAALTAFNGVSERTVHMLKLVQAAGRRLGHEQLVKRDVIGNWRQLIAYCRAAMGANKTQFRIIFLDRKNRVIKDEVQQRGTVDHTPVYPREVV